MIFKVEAAIIAVLLGVVAFLAVQASIYRGNAITSKDQRDKAISALNLAKDTITDMQTRQHDVAALDAKYTKELANAKAENDALLRKLDNGGRVLVKGKCPMPASIEAASTSGMGHDATVELSDVAGRNVLSIRAGIEQDQSALRVLQDYITQQCN